MTDTNLTILLQQRRKIGLIALGSFTVFLFGIFSSLVHSREIGDRDITLAVEKKLINDQSISSHLVDVWTEKGIVNLSGSADNLLAKERATQIAKTIKGVRSVVNRIMVRPVPRTDAQILRDIQ